MEPLAHSDSGHETKTNEVVEPAVTSGGDTARELGHSSLAAHDGSADSPVAQAMPTPVISPPQPSTDALVVTPTVSMPTGLDAAPAGPVSPVAVVRVLSPLGVEYVFMTICLFTSAGGLAAALIALANGKTDFQVLSFPTALLLVSVPIFAFLFLRAKKRELLQPALKLDPSKRRSTQFTQVVCFLISLFTLVGLVSAVFAKLGGQSHMSFMKLLLDCLVLLVVFGGILAYYWRDEHAGR